MRLKENLLAWVVRRKRFVRVVTVLFLVIYCIPMLAGTLAIGRMKREMKEKLSMTAESISWRWPMEFVVRGGEIPDPVGDNPFFLKAAVIRVQVPFWGVPVWLAIGSLPAKLIVERPHLMASSTNAAMLIGSMSVHPVDWLTIPAGGIIDLEKTPEMEMLRPPVIPLDLKIIRGKAEVNEEQLRAGQPLFIVDNIRTHMKAQGLLSRPSLNVSSYGLFKTPEGKIIGMHEIRLLAYPQEKYVEGFIRLRHEQLADFRNLYAHAPSPIYIDGGSTNFTTVFHVTEGRNLWFRATLMVQALDLDAVVGGIPLSSVMHAVEDEERRYEWSFEIDGDLGDPTFDPHDELLSEVEWEMKELAAANGVAVKTNLFFYSDMELEEPAYVVEPEGLPPPP